MTRSACHVMAMAVATKVAGSVTLPAKEIQRALELAMKLFSFYAANRLPPALEILIRTVTQLALATLFSCDAVRTLGLAMVKLSSSSESGRVMAFLPVTAKIFSFFVRR